MPPDDDATVQLLREIRDLLRQQGERQQHAIAVQQEAVANQLAAIRTQRRALRLLVPLVLGLAALLLVWSVLARGR